MRSSVKAILKRLIEIIETVEESLDNTNNADYPNEDRIEKLEAELEALEEAQGALEGIE